MHVQVHPWVSARNGAQVRRLSLVTFVGMPAMLFGLIGDVATGDVEAPESWKPWSWAAVVILAVAVTVMEAQSRVGWATQQSGTDRDLRASADEVALAVGNQWRREEEHGVAYSRLHRAGRGVFTSSLLLKVASR